LIAPTLQRLLTFQVPNLMSFFHCLGRAKESVQVRGALKHLVTSYIFKVRCCIPTPNPRAGDHPLLAVHYCLFYIFAATLRIWRPSIRNLRTRRAVVTRDPPNMGISSTSDIVPVKETTYEIQRGLKNNIKIGVETGYEIVD